MCCDRSFLGRRASLVGPSSNSLFYLGTLNMRNKSLDKGILLFQEVLRIAPLHVESLVELGTIHLIQESLDQAQTRFNQALALDPRNVIANLRMGKMFQVQL